MLKVVLDSTILVSGFLTPGGVAAEVIQHAKDGVFLCYAIEEILEETQNTLLYPRIQQRFRYTAEEVQEFCRALREAIILITNRLQLTVVRDPNDDMIIACAVAAQAAYVVTRDKDLLSLTRYEGIGMITPEEFMGILRERGEIA